MNPIEGARTWLIPDGYMATPPGDGKAYQSHEAICILNTGVQDARIMLDIYFEDRAPLKNIAVTVQAERTFHVRLDKPEHLGGAVLPRDVPYAVRVRADVPVIVQHSRLDTTQPNMALMTTIAYPVEE
ncbi:MAG: hypothetical protein HZB53_10680 [Chloroflexi bacterium]|nr:hypothetical protein [Chloroflexota bacterium]